MAERSKLKQWAPWAAGAATLVWLARRGGDAAGPAEGTEGHVGPQPRQKEDTTTVGHQPAPGVHRIVEEDLPPRVGPPPVVRVTRVVYATNGNPSYVEVDVPVGAYEITVRAMLPDIGWTVKLGGKEYGIGKGPPGSTPVLSAIAAAVNVAARLAPMIAGDAYSAAVVTAVKAITTIVNAMPDLVQRNRVRIWTKFTAAKYGKGSVRKKMRSALKKWYDPDRTVAFSMGDRRGYWRFTGNTAGLWPMVSDEPPPSIGKPIPAGAPITAVSPSIVATSLVGSYLRIRFESASSSYTGQIRYDVSVFN